MTHNELADLCESAEVLPQGMSWPDHMVGDGPILVKLRKSFARIAHQTRANVELENERHAALEWCRANGNPHRTPAGGEHLVEAADRIAALEAALRDLIEQCHDCEKRLTEELHHMTFTGESLPLCSARTALERPTHD